MKINVPTKLSEIALGDFQLYKKSQQTDEDKLKYILKLSDPVVKAIKRTDFEELVDRVDALLNEPLEFLPFFKINGKKFGFIPNFEDMTNAEYMDLASSINDIETLHYAMAVMFRMVVDEKGEKYAIMEYDSKHGFEEIMKQAPLNVALGSKVFFWSLIKELEQTIPNYLAHQAVEMSFQQLHNLEKNGVGTLH